MGGGFLGFDSLIEKFDLDFNIADFNMLDNDQGEIEEQQRIIQPRIDKESVTNTILFENAVAFANQIDLDPNVRTFAWVSGNFIFGDIIEALARDRDVIPRKLYVSTLSLSQENIDSFANILGSCPEIEKFVLLISGYFYSHEKFKLVPYMYDTLDRYGDKVQIVFGNYHCKLFAMETTEDKYIVCHGSANLRSSNSIEQVMFEQSKELYEFNSGLFDKLAEKFGTINYNAEPTKLKRMEGNVSWQAVAYPTGNGSNHTRTNPETPTQAALTGDQAKSEQPHQCAERGAGQRSKRGRE